MTGSTSMEERERRYRVVVEHSRDAISLTCGGVVEWISPAIESIIGHTPDELVGGQILDHVHPDDHPMFDATRARNLGGDRSPSRLRFRMRHRDGSWHWVDLMTTPLVDDSGGPVGGVGNWRLVDDEVAYIEALSRSEAANRELAAQLQEALDSRVVIEQAKGMVAGQRDITVDEAFEVLRDHGRRHGMKVRAVAEAVVRLGLRL